MRITIELRDGSTHIYENFVSYSVVDDISVYCFTDDEKTELISYVFEKICVLKVTVEYFIN